MAKVGQHILRSYGNPSGWTISSFSERVQYSKKWIMVMVEALKLVLMLAKSKTEKRRGRERVGSKDR